MVLPAAAPAAYTARQAPAQCRRRGGNGMDINLFLVKLNDYLPRLPSVCATLIMAPASPGRLPDSVYQMLLQHHQQKNRCKHLPQFEITI
jgi:hypothetical protein